MNQLKPHGITVPDQRRLHGLGRQMMQFRHFHIHLGPPHEILGTMHGVKQGCPLSCFLLVLVFDISP